MIRPTNFKLSDADREELEHARRRLGVRAWVDVIRHWLAEERKARTGK